MARPNTHATGSAYSHANRHERRRRRTADKRHPPNATTPLPTDRPCQCPVCRQRRHNPPD